MIPSREPGMREGEDGGVLLQHTDLVWSGSVVPAMEFDSSILEPAPRSHGEMGPRMGGLCAELGAARALGEWDGWNSKKVKR